MHLQCRRPCFDSWVGKICWRRDRLPTPVFLDFPWGSAGKESACNVEDLGSISGLGRSPGEGKGYPLQYSDLENSVDCIAHYNKCLKDRIQVLCLFLFSCVLGTGTVAYMGWMGFYWISRFIQIPDFLNLIVCRIAFHFTLVTWSFSCFEAYFFSAFL